MGVGVGSGVGDGVGVGVGSGVMSSTLLQSIALTSARTPPRVATSSIIIRTAANLYTSSLCLFSFKYFTNLWAYCRFLSFTDTLQHVYRKVKEAVRGCLQIR